jgi:hypothetical protein
MSVCCEEREGEVKGVKTSKISNVHHQKYTIRGNGVPSPCLGGGSSLMLEDLRGPSVAQRKAIRFTEI